MLTLAQWLKEQLRARNLTQQAAAVHAGVSGGTLSDILNKDHIPRLDILFRLADYFDTPREYLVRLAARMPLEDSQPVDTGQEDILAEELLAEFRKIPDEWKPEVLAQMRIFVRLANLPTVRFIGADPQEEQHEP
jgi:transcriptional regulator with XRE-family HTH domain